MRLVGHFQGSGYRDDRCLAQTADGSLVQLTPELYAIAESVDGRRSYAEIASDVEDRTGTALSADDVWVLAAGQLRPAGVLTHADGSEPQSDRLDPLLALRVRRAVVPAKAVHTAGRLLAPLCSRVSVVLGLVGYLATVTWLVVDGMSSAMDALSSSPGAFLAALGVIFLAAAWHELGHATACVRAGGRPGEIGAGFYLLWPAFYTDVTDAYRLSRRSRLAVDLGGLYFSALFSVGVAAAFLATQQPILPVLLVLVQIQMAQQLLPFVRFDGYYVLSDLTGVPDLFLRLGSILKSLLPWRRTPDEVRELRTGVRVTVTVWVVLTVVLLGSLLSYALWRLPEIAMAALEVSGQQGARALHAVQQGEVVTAAAAGVRALIPAILPLVLGYVVVRLASRLLSAVVRRLRDTPQDDAAESSAAPASDPGGQPAAAQDASSAGRRTQADEPVPPRERYWWELDGSGPPRADLTTTQERVLGRRATDPDTSASMRRRARIVLAVRSGWGDAAIAQAVGASRSTVGRWRRRFRREGTSGLGLDDNDGQDCARQE